MKTLTPEEQVKKFLPRSKIKGFQYSVATYFAAVETLENTSRFLTKDQAKKLALLRARGESNDVIRNLLQELRNLSACIGIKGFTGKTRKTIDLCQWATDRTAMLPTPYPDTVLDKTSLDDVLNQLSDSATDKDVQNAIAKDYDNREKQFEKLRKKYLQGLLLSVEKNESISVEKFLQQYDSSKEVVWVDRCDNEGEVLFTSESSMEIAAFGFDTWLEGLSVAYDFLHGNDKAEILQALMDVCCAQGVLTTYQDAPKVGRPKLADDAEQMKAVAAAIVRYPKAPKAKLIAQITISRAPTPCARTVERWLKQYKELPDLIRKKLEDEARQAL